MKYARIIGLICLVIVAVGCADKQTPAPVVTSEIVTVSEVAYLNEELRELREYLENDPKFLLHLMDRDLDAVEHGRDARGSFSDYFVPNMAQALKAGASKKDVEDRLNRAIALAERELYLSSFIAQLMNEGGPDAVRSYAFGWIGQ
jgi:predicted nucleic-acid-binding protein